MLLNNWMKNMGDEKSLKEINIPGTHDSGAKYCSFSLFSHCQNKSISEQLKIGVRVFDIRVDGMTIVHSFCKCKKSRFGALLSLENVIDDILCFLSEKPSETVLMMFKMDKGNDSSECFRLLYENFIRTNPDKWYLENKVPTLGEVRGKIILIRRTESNFEKAGIDFTEMPYQGDTKETKWEKFSPNGVDDVIIQDRYRLTRKNKWNKAVRPLIEDGEGLKDSMIFNFLSSAAIPFIPLFNARYINKKFSKHKPEKGKYYGVIMLDFADEKLTRKIIETNF